MTPGRANTDTQQRRILKFVLQGGGLQIVRMPAGSRPLSLQLQHGLPTLWAECPDDSAPVDHRVEAVVTGVYLPAVPCQYLGTLQFNGGAFVLHYYLITGGQHG